MTRMIRNARGLWLVTLATGACLDRGSLGDYEGTGTGGSTSDGESDTTDAVVPSTSAPTDATSTSDTEDDSGTTGPDEPIALCVQSTPIAALAGHELMPVWARTLGSDHGELWTTDETWDPLAEVLSLELSPHAVSVDGEATPDGGYGVVGAFVRFADIDGDGADDLLVREDDVLNWRRIGGGSVGLPEPVVLPSEDAVHGWFDADGDTIVDVFVLREIGGEGPDISLWSGDGAGGFTLHSQLEGAFAPLYAVSGVQRAPNGRLAVEASNEAIGFGLAWSAWEVEVTAGGMVAIGGTDVIESALQVTTDFDDDGRLDFVMGDINNQTHLLRHADGAYLQTALSDYNGFAAIADFLGTGTPSLLLAGGSEVVLFEAPHDPAVPGIVLQGDPITLNAEGALDVDGDGRWELLDDDYDFEVDAHRPAIVQIVPCE